MARARRSEYSSQKTETPDEPLDPDDKKPEKELKVEAGLNRFVWDLHYENANRVPGYYRGNTTPERVVRWHCRASTR